MELRDQLAQHESELATLKRKWERIVSRAGNSLGGTVGSSPDNSPSPSARSKPLPGSGDGVNEVVGAIRDGVTGLGRMLVMGGLSSPVQIQSSQSSTPATPIRAVERSSAVQSSTLTTGSSSRNSSISSITVTSPPASSTGRTSLSSVTSVASDDEQDDLDEIVSLKDNIADDGGHTPTLDGLSSWSSDKIDSPDFSLTSSPATPAAQFEDLQAAGPVKPREPLSKRLSMGPSTPSSRRSLNLADRLAEKKPPARLLTSPPPSSSPTSWVPTSLNKRFEGLQKSDTYVPITPL